MTARDIIVFEPMPDDEPALKCNCCGTRATGAGRLRARLFPYMNQNESCDFVVCSKNCAIAFKQFPTLDHYVMRCIRVVAVAKNLYLRPSFQIWWENINHQIINN